jgi:hypothetical protein
MWFAGNGVDGTFGLLGLALSSRVARLVTIRAVMSWDTGRESSVSRGHEATGDASPGRCDGGK